MCSLCWWRKPGYMCQKLGKNAQSHLATLTTPHADTEDRTRKAAVESQWSTSWAYRTTNVSYITSMPFMLTFIALCFWFLPTVPVSTRESARATFSCSKRSLEVQSRQQILILTNMFNHVHVHLYHCYPQYTLYTFKCTSSSIRCCCAKTNRLGKIETVVFNGVASTTPVSLKLSSKLFSWFRFPLKGTSGWQRK